MKERRLRVKETLNCTPEVFFNFITDYESYPDFFPMIKEVEVLKDTSDAKEVYFNCDVVVKKFEYTLLIKEVKNKGIHCELVSSNFFSLNSSSWDIKDLGDQKVEVTYDLEVEFKIPLPKILLNRFLKKETPKVMDICKREVERIQSQK